MLIFQKTKNYQKKSKTLQKYTKIQMQESIKMRINYINKLWQLQLHNKYTTNKTVHK